MAWVRIDDQFFLHPKVAKAGKDAALLYLGSLTYAAGQLTDGRIEAAAVRLISAMVDVQAKHAKRLVEVGLWEECEGGYMIHDYHEYNPSRDKVLATREARAEAGARGGKQKASNLLQQQPSKLPEDLLDGSQNNAVANGKQNSTPFPIPYPEEEIQEQVLRTSDASAPPAPPDPAEGERKPEKRPAAKAAVALTERQIKHRAMFGALCEAFSSPASDQEKGRYETAAKDLVAASVEPGEIPHLVEAWGWINPPPVRVNSLAGQLTVLRNATAPQAKNRAASTTFVDRADAPPPPNAQIRRRVEA